MSELLKALQNLQDNQRKDREEMELGTIRDKVESYERSTRPVNQSQPSQPMTERQPEQRHGGQLDRGNIRDKNTHRISGKQCLCLSSQPRRISKLCAK